MADEVARIAPPVAVASVDEEAEGLAEFGPRYSLKDIRQVRAIRGFLRSGKVKDACQAAGVKYGAWYRWLDEDPEFARALEMAKNIRADELEEVAETRARDSSDTLLLALLKAMRPEKYREKQTITVVSPDVQGRLSRQADVIVEVCRREIGDSELRARLTTALANGLREVWT